MGIIEKRYRKFKNQHHNYFTKIFGYFIELMRDWCINEHPTCEDCPFNEQYKGCLFRGKSPKEW